MTFGQTIRAKRNSKGFSQQYVSGKTEIPQTTLSDWERDKSLPNVVEAYKIASVLGCSLNALVKNLQSTGTDCK
jgi:putative transcriptional regulator